MIIEIILVVSILALICVGGYTLYKACQKMKANGNGPCREVCPYLLSMYTCVLSVAFLCIWLVIKIFG